MRWTTERFMALVASGVIPERRGIELLDGQVVTEMPQGDAHFDALNAIQRALAALGGFDHGMMVGPTIILPGDTTPSIPRSRSSPPRRIGAASPTRA